MQMNILCQTSMKILKNKMISLKKAEDTIFKIYNVSKQGNFIYCCVILNSDVVIRFLLLSIE